MSKIFVLPFVDEASLEAQLRRIAQPMASDALLLRVPGELQARLWDVEREAGDFYVFGRGEEEEEGRAWREVAPGDVVLLGDPERYRGAFRVLAALPTDAVREALRREERVDAAGGPVFLVSEPESLDTPRSDLSADLGEQDDRFTRISQERCAALASAHGSLDQFLSTCLGAERTSRTRLAEPAPVPELKEPIKAHARRGGDKLPARAGDADLAARIWPKRVRRSLLPEAPGFAEFAAGMASARRLAVDVAVLSLAVLCLGSMGAGLFTDRLLIDPISVPPSYAEDGFHPHVMAHRLLDKVSFIRTRIVEHPDPQLARSWRGPQIRVSEDRLSGARIMDLVRSLVGLEASRVSGDLVREGDRLRMRLRIANADVFVEPAATPEDGLSRLLESGAREIVEATDPKLLSRYLYVIAEEHEREGRLGEAIESSREAVALDPDNAAAYVSWGAALRGQGDPVGAIERYEKAADLAPDFGPTYFHWANALMEQGEPQRAAELFAKATALDPDNARAWNNWGNLLRQQGEFEAAASHLKRATELEPDYADAWNNWGLALRAAGDFDSAIHKYLRATELRSDYAEAFYNWGNALAAKKDHDAAVVKYKRATEIDPEFAAAWNNLGLALAAQGEHEEAIERYRRAAEIDPDYTEAHNNWGLALHEREEFREAIARFERANETDPDSAAVYYNWGRSLHAARRFKEALAKYEKAMELEPDAFAFVSHRIESLKLER